MSFFTGLKEKLNSLAAADRQRLKNPPMGKACYTALSMRSPARYSSCRFICVPPMDFVRQKPCAVVSRSSLPNVSIDYDALYRIGIGGFFAEFSLSGVCKNLP